MKSFDIFEKSLNEDFCEAVFCSPLKNRIYKNDEAVKKYVLRPVIIKNEYFIQFESFSEKKAFHENMTVEDAKEAFKGLMKHFKELYIRLENREYHVFTNKGKEKIKEDIKKSAVTKKHNKDKNYIFNEGDDVEFLRILGLMTEDLKVVKKYYDKFKQINRYVELLSPHLEILSAKECINIVDFGCGRAYLTFALYHYLRFIKNKKVRIIGLDLKKDVIDELNLLKDKLSYEGLEFIHKDIKDYDREFEVDMVISLHACDTASDISIRKAVSWGSRLIFAVPCCQKELRRKIENENMRGLLKYGIEKESLSTLITDSLRALYLEKSGYDVKISEFIDLSHTKKNIMISGIKNPGKDVRKAEKEYEDLKREFNLDEIFLELV